MRINFLNVDEVCQNLPEVASNKVYSKKGFHPEGLFSERIFGPVRSCTCACGIYWGRSKVDQECPTCGVKISFSNMRRRTFAKIKLPFPIINPIMLYLLSKVGKMTLSKVIYDLIFDHEGTFGFYYNTDTRKYCKLKKNLEGFSVDAVPEGVEVYSGPDGVFNLVKAECIRNKDTNAEWMFIFNNLSKFHMNYIIVFPPEFRPVSKTKDSQMSDQINHFFMTILNFSLMNREDVTTDQDINIKRIAFRNLQRHVLNLYEFIFSKFSKKTGLIRGFILGKRIDFSGRAVIAPDPQLHLDQASLPYVIALELFKLDVANRLLEVRHFDNQEFIRYDTTFKYIDSCIDLKNFALFDMISQITNDKLVILNRQPTLHRMGMLSFKILVNKDSVIKIHPLVCDPYNADFDGDQMAAYISLYPETEQENKEKIFILENLISPSTGNMVISVNQDIVLGLYLLTKPDEKKKVKFGEIETYEGRVRFNEILPRGCPYINRTITKKELAILLNVLVKSFDNETMKNLLDRIKELGFQETTLRGATMSLKNISTDGVYDSVCRLVDSVTTTKEKYFALQNSKEKERVLKSFPYADFVDSGSRGSWDQVSQLIFCRGFISNSKGQIIPVPIKHNLIDGLTKEEFFISCYGSRKALLDVALNTAVSGYLTRKLVYCTVNLELDPNKEDCGTTDCLTVPVPENLTDAQIEERVKTITDEFARQSERERLRAIDPIKLMRSLIGRWIVNTKENGEKELVLITGTNYMQFTGKTLKVRSPIYCTSQKLCKRCYGETYKHVHSNYVGILAAQAAGEVATQLTLRTFHVGGIAQMSSNQDNESQDDIINDLSVVNKILHATAVTTPESVILKLFAIYSRHRILLLVHFEIILSQMMRIGDMRWRMHPNRATIPPQMISVENVPAKESFLLALAFSKPYNYIVSGILGNSVSTDGILEKILLNKI